MTRDPTEENTLDEVVAGMLRRIDQAGATIEELEDQLYELQSMTRNDPPISSVGMDEVFVMRELPAVLRMLDDLPPEVRSDPCRASELDLLVQVLRRVDVLVR